MAKPHNHGSSVSPEELHELQDYILNAEGKQGARRFERALDEVPNLVGMYKPNALKQTFTGDNAKAIATINPADFEKYAHAITPEHEKTRTYFGDKPEPRYEDILKHAGVTSKQYSSLPRDVQDHLVSRYKQTLPYDEMNHEQYIKHLASLHRFNDMPFLYLNKEETGLPLMPKITGHEGRHRNRALASKGHKKALVQIYPKGDLEGMPRSSSEEYLDALHKEMAMTNNMVQPEYRPQVSGEVKRSPILLPDMYDKGGDVHEKAKQMFLKDSKVKDVMYHGTNENFSQFYPYAKPKTQGGENLHGSGAMFFTPDRELANKYTGANKTDSTHPKMKETGGYHAWPPESIHGGNVMPVHLNMTNPLVVDAEGKMYHQVEHHILGAKKKGHDSVILKNVVDAPGSGGSLQTHKHDAHIVFNPKQIKSAIGNRGTYDPNDPDITKAEGGEVEEPTNTVKAYKLFRVHHKHPGKLFPLFVDANTPVEMNKWIDAKAGEMSGNKVKSKIGPLAFRPGWHAGDLPVASHIGEKSSPDVKAPDIRPHNHVWAEVEMPNDVDWQTVANHRGTNAKGKVIPVKAHITDQLPKGGHYRYKTNSNMTGNWLIGGSMKVNRVLDDKEVEDINKKAGVSDLRRAKPFDKKTYGFASGGKVAPQEWIAEEYVNYKKGGDVKPISKKQRAENKAKFLSGSKTRSTLYHATPHDFNEFIMGGKTRYRNGSVDPTGYLPSGKAAWFTDNPYEQPAAHNTGGYKGQFDTGTNVMPVHLSMKTPLVLDDPDMLDWAKTAFANGSGEFPLLMSDDSISQLRAEGYDSVIYKPNKKDRHNEYIVFEPHQIKSAIGNRGTYDPNDPDITKADGGDVRSNFKKQIDQIRAQSEMRQKVQDQYTKEHAHLVHDQWPTMQEWLNKKQGN